jgi:hypothetical protein
MSKKLLPRRDPAEIASELFRSCQWEEAGDVARAAHKAAYYIFHELIERLGVDHKRRQELVDYIATSTDVDKIQMARREVEFGANRAKYIFRHFGKLPLKTEINERKNNAVLDRFDRGVWDKETRKWRPCSMLEFAKLLAKENEALPLEQRKGPGGVDVPALAKHIENLVKKRERELAAGTWFGPITREQAVRHFGAKNVATFSKK